jgi:hypothetical protein
MRRLVIVAPLAPDVRETVGELLESGPPFDPQLTGFTRHGVYASDKEVVFVFEGAADVEWEVDDLVGDALHPAVTKAVEAWRPLLAAPPRVARERYFWTREEPGP